MHARVLIKTIRYKVIFIIWVLFFITSDVNFPNGSRQCSSSDKLHSSVWCSGPNMGMKTCHFRNLCYNENYGFLFILTNFSVVSGLNNYQEFKSLKLSPISHHTAVNMRLTVMRSSESSYKHVKFLQGHYFLLYRFKPDNFMHVIHDDLIPLYNKFRELCLGNVTICSSKYHLVFADSNKSGPFIHWYKAMSSKEPWLLRELSSSFTYCFSSMVVGVANTSFFQYGFKMPQGPIKTSLSGNDIKEFRNYYLEYFGIAILNSENVRKVTLISRILNRKIVNEDYVLKTVSLLIGDLLGTIDDTVLYKIDMITNKTEDILRAISSSDIVIGMHGAETLLSLFLPEHSTFIELFPFGIVRDNVSPVYSLSIIPRIHFNYISWHNMKEENSIVHPEYPCHFGGLGGFSQELVRAILNTKNIPAVECCNNPYYLFRMYQDTFVDDSFIDIASSAVNFMQSKRSTTHFPSTLYYPGPVLDLKCVSHLDHALVSWSIPFNVMNGTPLYNVSVLLGPKHLNVLTSELFFRADFKGNVPNTIQVWVFCQLGIKESIDSYCECKPHILLP